jgi:hypothetical protein
VICWVRKRVWCSWLNAPETDVFTTSIANNEPPRTYSKIRRQIGAAVRGRDCGLEDGEAVELGAGEALAIVAAVTSAVGADSLCLRAGDYVSGAAAKFHLPWLLGKRGGRVLMGGRRGLVGREIRLWLGRGLPPGPWPPRLISVVVSELTNVPKLPSPFTIWTIFNRGLPLCGSVIPLDTQPLNTTTSKHRSQETLPWKMYCILLYTSVAD